MGEVGQAGHTMVGWPCPVGVSVDVWGCNRTLISLLNKNHALEAQQAALCVRSWYPVMEEAGGLGVVGILGA